MQEEINEIIQNLTPEQHKRAVDFCKTMLERKRETQREMREEWRTNPEKLEVLNELRKRNAERGTPIASL